MRNAWPVLVCLLIPIGGVIFMEMSLPGIMNMWVVGIVIGIPLALTLVAALMHKLGVDLSGYRSSGSGSSSNSGSGGGGGSSSSFDDGD